MTETSTDQIQAAQLFSTVDRLLDGVDNNVQTYVLINLMSKRILNNCVGGGASELSAAFKWTISEMAEALLTNVVDDPHTPTVSELLQNVKPQ